MLEDIKTRAQKAAKKRIIVWAIVIVVLMLAPLLAPLQYLLGPKDLTKEKNLDYTKYEGKYVEFEIKYVFDYYMEQISKNTKTGSQRTTGYGYVVYNYEDNSCLAVYLPKSEDKLMQELMDQAVNVYYYQIEGTKSIKVKGTLKKLSGTELRYYNETVEGLEEYIPGITDAAVGFYVDSETVNRVPTVFIWIIYAVCVFGLFQIIISIVRFSTGSAQKQIDKFISAHLGVTEGQIDSDMRAAVKITNEIWAGHQFTIWLEGVKIHILDNSKLVWAYYYRVTGRQNISQVLTFDIDKKKVPINISKESGEKLLGVYVQTQPQMVIGYKSEIEKQYKKDFAGFLNIAYNPWKNGDYTQDQSSADGAYGMDNYSSNYGAGSSTVELTDAGQNTIEVIKVVREVTGLSLAEAKDLVESAPSIIKNGVTETEAQNIKAQLEAAGAGVSIR